MKECFTVGAETDAGNSGKVLLEMIKKISIRQCQAQFVEFFIEFK
jgi:hypothetical protein